MPRRLLDAWALATGLALTTPGLLAPASAQETPAAPPPSTELEQALAAWDRAAEPGPWHAFLAQRAGKWDVAGRIWNEPGGEPATSTGESRLEMVLGGRFLQERHKGQAGPRPYEGVGLLGVDNADTSATALWLDNLGTRTAVLRGKAGRPGDPLELRGTFTDPASGRTVSLRLVITWVSANEQRWDYYGAPEGFDEARMMELVYARRR